MTPFADSTALSRSPDAVSRVVAGEALIVDLVSGHYFGLDPVGTRVWELIPEKGTVGAVLAGILGEFEVGEAQARADLERLLAELLEKGLVRVGDGPG